ncbi:hypothetical protein IV203_016057 [Nitzschia inconspicua]|uniref:Uncharacterized protein n=1 Tax=Nitzschia inconspicua TaxID=303405 RepID=A0A9K3PH06_9STRA|nr:hypothetical protein IV203_016057 [Nitzschia inconspicua]
MVKRDDDVVDGEGRESSSSSAVNGKKKKKNNHHNNNNGSQEQIEDQMDQVLRLLSQRVQGQVSNEEVESAVNNVLSAMGTTTPSTTTLPISSSSSGHQDHRIIHEDTGNYDSDDNDNDNETNVKKQAAALQSEPHGTKRKFSDTAENCNSKDGHNSITKDVSGHTLLPSRNSFNQEEYDDAIGQIPMGWEAAKMMTTFGDGPHPRPDALEAALLGTRKTLQMAIMDARKIRRRLQQDFQKAEVAVDPNARKRQNDKKTKAKKKSKLQQQQQQDKERGTTDDASDANATSETSKSYTVPTQHPNLVEAADPTMVYRALASGTDKLSLDHKCGFHMEELAHLFPEEMRAYQRWTEMHEEYNQKKAEQEQLKQKAANGNLGEEDDDDQDDTSTPPSPITSEIEEPDGGHLKERAAHFDFRTNRMEKDWYMEYAKVRQGSFLPSAMRVRRTQAEKEWDNLRKMKKGRHFTGSWESMSGRSVRFLHWLGFDPPNLYPPDEEVTHALAFLAYDRLGRIVEKAIHLRNLETSQKRLGMKNEESKHDDSVAGTLWELSEGEQLTKQDIERALEDPDVKPSALFGTEDDAKQTSIQLYFGPGWEDRLELEMEEFLAATQGQEAGPQISEEERAFREQEAILLAKISAPPAIGEASLKQLVAEKKAQSSALAKR